MCQCGVSVGGRRGWGDGGGLFNCNIDGLVEVSGDGLVEVKGGGGGMGATFGGRREGEGRGGGGNGATFGGRREGDGGGGKGATFVNFHSHIEGNDCLTGSSGTMGGRGRGDLF